MKFETIGQAIFGVAITLHCQIASGQNLRAAQLPAEQLGFSKDTRLLIIEGEDLGMAHSINKATLEALEKGWISSAGVLVPAPWYPEVVRWARVHRTADLGIRLDLNSDWSSFRWRPVSSQAKDSGLIDSAGYLSSSELFVIQHANPKDAEKEARAQIELAKSDGLAFTHFDSHMRTMLMRPNLFRCYWELGKEYGIPIVLSKQILLSRSLVKDKTNEYSFGGVDINIQTIPIDREIELMPGLAKSDWLKGYMNLLAPLPPGIYLLSVHLGFADEELRAMTWDHPNWGAEWRQNDFEVVSSREFQDFLKNNKFALVSWKDLSKFVQP